MQLPTKDLRIYYINLKSRKDRDDRFLSQPGVQLLSKQYPFERVDGVDGKLLDLQKDDRVSLRTKRNILFQKRRDHEDLDTKGGIGCYLSHYNSWKKLLETNADKCIIFEDDAEVPDNINELVEQLLDDIYQEDVRRPDILLLSKPFGATLQKALDLSAVQYTGNMTYDVTGPLTGYILFRSGAKILCDNAFPIDGHVDHFMHRCAQMGMLVLAHNKRLSLKQVSLTKKDSNIQEASTCEVCNIPYSPIKKGYIILTNQFISAAVIGAVTIGGLMILGSLKK